MNFLETLLAMALSMSKSVLVEYGQKYIDTGGANAKADIASLYPQLDTRIETLAEKTPTPVDNSAVKVLKEACEELAAANGFTLSNVDGD